MLCELHLRNLAVAEDVSFELGPGLNVLSGSTGAGKSLITEAMRWLRGEPIDRGVLRAGADSASAEATFDLHTRPELIEQLRERAVELADDGMLRLRRELVAGGRSRAWVDGRLASAALLQAIGSILVQSQQQHLQLGLLEPRRHVDTLDSLGVAEDLVREWADARAQFLEAGQALARWTEERARLLEQREAIEFQWRDLDAAGLQAGELDGLRRKVSVMEGGARLLELAATARAQLEDDPRGAAPALAAALGQLRKAPDGVPELDQALETVTGAVELVSEAIAALEQILDGAELEPAAFEQAQERLALLTGLARRYARSEDELIAMRDRLREQLDGLGSGDEVPPALLQARADAAARVNTAGKALHKERKRVARSAARDATPLLAELGMQGAALSFDFMPEANADGPVRIDGRQVTALAAGPAEVTLLVRTNPGENPTPVHRGASGGELSRIALVLRSLALRGQAPALLLLDEVDAGVGADLAAPIARRLAALAEAGQLLVITHQAQIAAGADRHLVALKETGEQRASSAVHRLDREGRIEELSRMVGAGTARSRKLVEEMLEAGGKA